MATEKSLDELRAAIESETTDSDVTTPDEKDPTEQSASEETTDKEPVVDNPTTDNSKEDEWVVPGKFRTHEDVLEAYRNAESQIGRQGSEIQRLRAAVQEPPRRGESTEERNARLKKFADELTADPERAIEERVKRVVNEVRGEVKASEFQRAYMERKKDAEFAELEPIMTQIATQYGDMIMANGMQNDPRLLDILHYAAKGIKAAELAKQAESKGIKKGEEKARQKNKARVEGASGTPKPKKLDISKLSAKEMKEKLLKGEIDPKE